ncbi:MAG: hypothetical protein RRY64_09680, partial [Oscillospiraceae bacterium]
MAAEVARHGLEHGVCYDVLIEVDTDGHRSGIAPADPLLLDVAAALKTTSASAKSVVKGTVTGNWKEVPNLAYLNDFALVLPTDGSNPKIKLTQIKLTLRGYDGVACNLSATGVGLTPTGVVGDLAPGSEAELVFTLQEMPTAGVFETTITVAWINKDGTTGSETVPVFLSVIKAASGAQLLAPNFYQTNDILPLWIFEENVNIELPVNPADPVTKPFELEGGMYYFGENVSMTVTKSAGYNNLTFKNAYMMNPQISGDVDMVSVNMEAVYERKTPSTSTIQITG